MISLNLYTLVRKHPEIQIDPEDLEILGRYMASLCKGYVRIWLKKTAVYLHTLIIVAPEGQEVDHKDTDGLNNKRSNLRFATNAQNTYNQNLRQDNTSGHKGVHWYKERSKYQAYFEYKGIRLNLGYFEKYEDACNAYDRIAKVYAGEFHRGK